MVIHLGHGKEAISHRSDRCAMEADRTVDSSGQVGRAAAVDQHAGSARRDLLHHPHRMCVANVAARLSALENGLRILLCLARRRHLDDDERPAARAGSPPSRAEVRATHWPAGQSEHEDVGPSGRTRLRRGKKRSKGESGTCSLTRWGWFFRAWCMPPACRIATAGNGCWRRPRSISLACESSAPTPGTRGDSSLGREMFATGRWRSSVVRLRIRSVAETLGRGTQ